MHYFFPERTPNDNTKTPYNSETLAGGILPISKAVIIKASFHVKEIPDVWGIHCFSTVPDFGTMLENHQMSTTDPFLLVLEALEPANLEDW